eukprot:3407976-Amphidinium_carterae.3
MANMCIALSLVMWNTANKENFHEGVVRCSESTLAAGSCTHVAFHSGSMNTCPQTPKESLELLNLLKMVITCCLVFSGLQIVCHQCVDAPDRKEFSLVPWLHNRSSLLKMSSTLKTPTAEMSDMEVGPQRGTLTAANSADTLEFGKRKLKKMVWENFFVAVLCSAARVLLLQRYAFMAAIIPQEIHILKTQHRRAAAIDIMGKSEKSAAKAGKRIFPAGALSSGQTQTGKASAAASSSGPAVKRARPIVKDERCTCSLCKESPEDLFTKTSNNSWEHTHVIKNFDSSGKLLNKLLIQKWLDRSWALYAQSGIGAKIPQGDMCEQCFDLWHKGFRYMEWAALCKLASDDDAFGKVVESARQVMLGKKKPPELGAHVESLTQLGVEVYRSFIAVSEKEMRRESQQTRIKKSSLKGIPSVMVPAEDGGGEMEQLFLFHDPSQPWRKANLKVIDAVVRNQPHMSETCLWAGQPEKYHTMSTQQLFDQNGVQQVLEKDSSGHLSLLTWETFKEQRLLDNKDTEETDYLGAELAEHLVGDAFEFSGPAAAAPASLEPPGSTPGSKPKTSQKKGDRATSAGGPLQRLFSSSSVVEALDHDDGASVHGPAGSVAGESAAGRSDMDDENLTGAGGVAEAKSLCGHACLCWFFLSHHWIASVGDMHIRCGAMCFARIWK